MGALVTIASLAEPGVANLPWIVTIGPLGDDEDWEPVVCGPYVQEHALALGRAAVIEDDLMAVVEPIRPHLSAERIRAEISTARAAAAADSDRGLSGGPAAGGFQAGGGFPDSGPGSLAVEAASEIEPTEDQVRAGFERIAKLLTSA